MFLFAFLLKIYVFFFYYCSAISCGNVRAELLDVAGVTWECNEARGNNISVSKIAFAVSNFRAYSNSR